VLGTILNAAGILIGGIVGLTVSKQLPPVTQKAIKGFLGVLTVYVGLKLSWSGLGGGFGAVLKQLLIVLLALVMGRLTGRLLHLQKGLNRLGQYAKEKFSHAGEPGTSHRFGDGFVTCTLLFCVGPMAILGAVQDGLEGRWETLGIKAIMDGLATMAFVTTFGWGAILSLVPVVAYQGTITLAAKFLTPLLEERALMDAVNATGGLLVFCIALVILELKKVELADYLPSLAFAPLLTWAWR